MTTDAGEPGGQPAPPAGEPPRAVLYALYVLLVIILFTVLVIVGVYAV